MSRSPERSGLKSIVDRLISVAQGKEEVKYTAPETPPREIVVSQDRLKAVYSERKHLIPIIATLKDVANNTIYGDEAHLEKLIEKAGAVLTQIDARLDEVGELVAIGIATDEDYIEVGLLTELQSELLSWNIDELKLYVESLHEADAPTEVEVKKEKFVPRNDWERYLQQNFVDEEFELPDEESDHYQHEMEERYEKLRSRFHSILLSANTSGITHTELKLPELHHTKISITGTDRTYDAHSILSQITQGNLSVKERAIAMEFLEILEADFDFYSVLLGTNKKFITEGGGQTLDGIKKTYDPNNATLFNDWFWKTMAKFPRFAYYDAESGKWIEEEESMGEKIFTAFRQILVRGRKDSNEILRQARAIAEADGVSFAGLDEVRDAGEIRSRLQDYISEAVDAVGKNADAKERLLFVELKNTPKKLRTARYYAGGKEWKPKAVAVKSVGELAVFPWKTAFTYSSLVTKNYDQIRHHVSSAYDDGRADKEDWKIDKDLNAKWGTLLAMALAEITFEGGYQDSRGGKGSALGKPNGAREIDRIMNVTEYASKTVNVTYDDKGREKVDRTGEYSIGTIGAVRRFFLPFLDYFGYEGKTLTEHIMESDSFADIPWSQVLNRDATQAWCQQITDATPLAEIALGGGFKAGDLRKLGKVDIEAAEVSNVNTAFVREFRTFYRKLMGYIYSRDSAPSAARSSVPESVDPTVKKNPTGKYIQIRVVEEKRDGSGRIILDDTPGTRETVTEYDSEGNEKTVHREDPVRSFTRIHQYFHISPEELHRWVDRDRRVKSYFTLGEGTEPGVMTVVVKRTKPEKAGELGNLIDPQILIARELIFKFLFMTQYEGDVIKDLKKEDILLLGMMLSSEIREKFRQRYFSGILSEMFTRTVEKFLGEESFFSPEVPNVEGPDVFTLETFNSLLFFMGYEYRIEDLIRSGGELFTALSSGALPTKK